MAVEARALAEGRALIRIERRAARHAVAGLGMGHPVRARHEALRGAGFRPAARYAHMAEIAAHLAELRALIAAAHRAAPPRADVPIATGLDLGLDDTDRSGAPRPEERCHTEDTTDPQTGSWSGAAGGKQSAPTEPEHPTDGPGSSREESGEKTTAARDAERRGDGAQKREDGPEPEPGPVPPSRLPPAVLARLTPAALREMASEEMRLYVDHLDPRPPGRPPSLRDLERAALMRRREMGVSPALWEEAEAALGWLDALVALVVVDANRQHPTAPVRNPAGLLRDLARRRRAGTLDLGASVMGLWKRTAS